MNRPRELSSTLSLFPAVTPTLLPATHTNSYALGAREVLLVEPATPYEAEQKAWLAWARGLVSAGREPVAIFATHHHPDHVGGLEVLARELDLPVWAHAETVARLTPSLQAQCTRAIEDGDVITLDGPAPEAWEVLHTPGHAWGHLCLWHPRSRTAIVGDMVASAGSILIAPGDGDMKLYLEQLGRLARLGATLALPAHGEPIDEPGALFEKYIAHRLQREAKVLAALPSAGGPFASAPELLPRAYADTPMHLWPLAALSLSMHLKKLVDEGRAKTRGESFAKAA